MLSKTVVLLSILNKTKSLHIYVVSSKSDKSLQWSQWDLKSRFIECFKMQYELQSRLFHEFNLFWPDKGLLKIFKYLILLFIYSELYWEYSWDNSKSLFSNVLKSEVFMLMLWKHCRIDCTNTLRLIEVLIFSM